MPLASLSAVAVFWEVVAVVVSRTHFLKMAFVCPVVEPNIFKKRVLL
jgi:hypothetical protein